MIQRNKFITDNHKLIYQFAHDHNINLNEYYDILAIALIKAADTYNKEKGFTFGTYAYSVMKNEYLMELRKKRKDGLNYSVSLENLIVDDIPFIEIIHDDNDIRDFYKESMELFFKNLEDDEKRVLYYLAQEYNQKQIGRKMNLSQSYISRKITKIRNKYKQLANGGELKWKK